MKVSAIKIKNSDLPAHKQVMSPSFKGGYVMSREITKRVIGESAPLTKFLMNLGKNNGEILNALVTAAGTALVAPVFIAFNPFAKEDKETKIYSALRQPISAVIALAATLGVNIKFNNWLDKLASTGKLDRANLRAKPRASYLKKIIDAEGYDMSKADIQAEIQYRQDNAFWKKVNTSRSKMKNVPISTEDLVDSNAMDDAKSIVKKQYREEIKKLGKKEADDFIFKKAKEIVVDNVDKTLRNEAQNKLDISKLAESGKPINVVIGELKTKLKQAVSAGNNKEIGNLQYIINKLTNLGDFKYMKKHGNTFEEVFQSVRIKRMVKAGINNAEDVLKLYKKRGGIIISLVTLPFTCSLLNWSYPRIMERIMPYLYDKDKDGGNA